MTPSATSSKAVISRGSFSLDLAAKRPMVGKINDMFKAKSGKDLNDFSSRQFMGLIVMADAINRAKSTDGDKIREALVATDMPGKDTIMPWKRVKFDEMGQNNDADPVLLQYIGGKFVTIFPPQAAVAEAIWPMKYAGGGRPGAKRLSSGGHGAKGALTIHPESWPRRPAGMMGQRASSRRQPDTA